MTDRPDIDARLENWARKFRDRQLRADAKTITAVICHQMQEAKLGNIYDSENGIAPQDTPDDIDAYAIEQGMRNLSTFDRLLLYWCYIEQARPEVVCRKLSIAPRPASVFVDAFRAAQESIEDIVDNEGNR